MKHFERIIIQRINNGFLVTSVRQLDDNEHPILKTIGAVQYEEVTNAFHSLHEVSNFIGNLAEQERLSK